MSPFPAWSRRVFLFYFSDIYCGNLVHFLVVNFTILYGLSMSRFPWCLTSSNSPATFNVFLLLLCWFPWCFCFWVSTLPLLWGSCYSCVCWFFSLFGVLTIVRMEWQQKLLMCETENRNYLDCFFTFMMLSLETWMIFNFDDAQFTYFVFHCLSFWCHI